MPSAVPRPRRRITSLAAVTLALGVLALAAPLGESEYPASRIGALLALAAVIEALHSLRRSTAAARREATVSAVISMAIALFLINAPLLAGQALRLVIAGWFGLDAVRHAIDLLRGDERMQRSVTALAALANLAVVLLILLAPGWLSTMIVALAGALRIFGIAWNIIVAPVHTSAEADETVIGELGLTDYPGAAAMAAEVEAAERTRAPIDRGWTLSFIATLFAIHLGRMSTDLTLLSMAAPAVAVAGDMLIAVLFTLLVINPTYLLWRGPTRWIERRAWPWQLDRGDARRSWIDHVVGGVAPLEADHGHPDSRAALLGACRARERPATRAAVCRDHRRHRSRLGHELVFRHRELGGRHVELLGRVAHRHVARLDGARGAGIRGWHRRPHELCHRTRASAPGISRSSSSATRAKATPLNMCCAISC